jgi:hypothetical protein
LLPGSPKGLTVESCAIGIGKSRDRAAQLLDELSRVGLLVHGPGTPRVADRPSATTPPQSLALLLSKPWNLLTTWRTSLEGFSMKTHPRHTREEEKEDTQGGSLHGKVPRQGRRTHASGGRVWTGCITWVALRAISTPDERWARSGVVLAERVIVSTPLDPFLTVRALGRHTPA